MPWSCPAEVNFHEASAFARWRSRQEEAAAAAAAAAAAGAAGAAAAVAGAAGGVASTIPFSLPSSSPPYRLLTEAEHHCLRSASDKQEGEGGREGGREDVILSHSGASLRPFLNLNLAWGMPSPVDAYPPNDKGFRDVRGSVWEWCEDHFSPLPGFEPHPHYMDFSLPCFDGQHQMIMVSQPPLPPSLPPSVRIFLVVLIATRPRHKPIFPSLPSSLSPLLPPSG